MKRVTFLFAFALSVAAGVQAQGNWSFKGTVTKMQMGGCAFQHGFMTTVSGSPVAAGATCPEYTVMSDKVVYVVVARRAEDFLPLAEDIDFLIRRNEMVISSDDVKARSRFVIQQMTLRADWDREEARKELAAQKMERSVNYEVRNPPRTTTEARVALPQP